MLYKIVTSVPAVNVVLFHDMYLFPALNRLNL